jgi:hypothetical protein
MGRQSPSGSWYVRITDERSGLLVGELHFDPADFAHAVGGLSVKTRMLLNVDPHLGMVSTLEHDTVDIPSDVDWADRARWGANWARQHAREGWTYSHGHVDNQRRFHATWAKYHADSVELDQ